VFVSRLLAGHRRELGTRNGARALTCWKQALFALAWFRDRPDIRRLGQGFGISQATAYRYKDEAVEVLAATAPTLREAWKGPLSRDFPTSSWTVPSSPRTGARTRKPAEREGNRQVVLRQGAPPRRQRPGTGRSPRMPLWVSGALPGSTHDLTAARELVLPQARPRTRQSREVRL